MKEMNRQVRYEAQKRGGGGAVAGQPKGRHFS